jgi:hypothetical protein
MKCGEITERALLCKALNSPRHCHTHYEGVLALNLHIGLFLYLRRLHLGSRD